ncbi:antibiotic biosynthesis monooxygenase [Antribacter sp. KLBMP9083]|uniref:Antibiotic biosynthesis monooxygenase n=1 Tax=Antribacter soli TaxID=2910976 RepID=A0AA41QDV5_9MICO|nr:antibiotic biosynthesis monooxygenase [Antribacter soli]MCF4121358.1 antibiotic biosynthesis monooxygenase [Antribacter soli]
MFVRTSEVRGDPARIDDGLRLVREEIYPAVSAMDGCAGMSLLVDRQTGRCIATTSWRSEDAMLASADAVRPLRDRAEQALGSTSGSDVHQWEVAVVHRDHAAPEGAWARLTWLSGDPSMVDHAIDTYRMVVLPKIQELDGFCSSSLMVDREAGRVVGTAAFETREAVEGSRDAATRIRTGVVRELGAKADVEEMEIAFAHLHVPEMV